jgi:HAD superfamily hydrolase (TIGR01509 family)
MSGADLIIFDCDGVLVDSEPLSMRTLVAAIGAQGFEVTIETAYRDYLGRSLASISSSLRDSHGAPLSAATLESMRHDLYALYRRELTANPGVADVLDTIGIPFCVASSSSVERVKLSLELSGLLPRFGDDRIFSSSMVTRGKPAPDLFLHVAKTLGARPERCVVIEDSPAGIAAARAANMRVFAYLGGTHVEPGGLRAAVAALEPDAIFDDMRLLPDLVSSRQKLKTAG